MRHVVALAVVVLLTVAAPLTGAHASPDEPTRDDVIALLGEPATRLVTPNGTADSGTVFAEPRFSASAGTVAVMVAGESYEATRTVAWSDGWQSEWTVVHVGEVAGFVPEAKVIDVTPVPAAEADSWAVILEPSAGAFLAQRDEPNALNVYAGPSHRSPVVGTVITDAAHPIMAARTVTVDGLADEAMTPTILPDGTVGWVWTGQLDFRENPGPGDMTGDGEVTTDQPVFRFPADFSDRVGDVSAGTVIPTGEPVNGFVPVTVDGVTGWVPDAAFAPVKDGGGDGDGAVAGPGPSPMVEPSSGAPDPEHRKGDEETPLGWFGGFALAAFLAVVAVVAGSVSIMTAHRRSQGGSNVMLGVNDDGWVVLLLGMVGPAVTVTTVVGAAWVAPTSPWWVWAAAGVLGGFAGFVSVDAFMSWGRRDVAFYEVARYLTHAPALPALAGVVAGLVVVMAGGSVMVAVTVGAGVAVAAACVGVVMSPFRPGGPGAPSTDLVPVGHDGGVGER